MPTIALLALLVFPSERFQAQTANASTTATLQMATQTARLATNA
jgi:hypothetical protein